MSLSLFLLTLLSVIPTLQVEEAAAASRFGCDAGSGMRFASLTSHGGESITLISVLPGYMLLSLLPLLLFTLLLLLLFCGPYNYDKLVANLTTTINHLTIIINNTTHYYLLGLFLFQ